MTLRRVSDLTYTGCCYVQDIWDSAFPILTKPSWAHQQEKEVIGQPEPKQPPYFDLSASTFTTSSHSIEAQPFASCFTVTLR